VTRCGGSSSAIVVRRFIVKFAWARPAALRLAREIGILTRSVPDRGLNHMQPTRRRRHAAVCAALTESEYRSGLAQEVFADLHRGVPGSPGIIRPPQDRIR
jgi:hypothetical protein